MIIDLHSFDMPATIEADICIIGAGAAGIVLSQNLARTKCRVVLLESGGREFEADTHQLNTVTSVGLPHLGVHDGRFRALGGSTTRWIGQMLPLDPIDFERRSWVAWSGWPLRYRMLTDYYRRALDVVGLGNAFRTDDEIWRRIGIAPQLGNGLMSYCSRWCPQPDLSQVFADTLTRSDWLQCILHATVKTFSVRGDAADSVVASSLNGRSVRVRARAFLVCVGGIETPRLLLQPLEDGRPAPWAGSDAIGRYFQDHLFGSVGEIVARNPARLHESFDRIYAGGLKYHPRFNLSEAMQRQSRLLGAGGLVTFETSKMDLINQTREACREILQRRISRDVLARAASGMLRGAPTIARLLWRGIVQGRAFNPHDLGTQLVIQLEQAPRPESRITLADETDALGMRRAKLDWRLGQLELDTVAAFARTAKAAFEAAGLATIRVHPEVEAGDQDALSRLRDLYHHAGTARMADDPAGGVVDTDLRVFGSRNVYVCGSAVFPTSGVANPTHTILALALRLADHLRARPAYG